MTMKIYPPNGERPASLGVPGAEPPVASSAASPQPKTASGLSASTANAPAHKAIAAGDKVWLVYQSYGKRPEAITEQVVDKVGRKYFTLVDDRNRYDLITMREVSQYAPSYTVIRDMQEYHDQRERRHLWSELKALFRSYEPELSLETLRAMRALAQGIAAAPRSDEGARSTAESPVADEGSDAPKQQEHRH